MLLQLRYICWPLLQCFFIAHNLILCYKATQELPSTRICFHWKAGVYFSLEWDCRNGAGSLLHRTGWIYPGAPEFHLLSGNIPSSTRKHNSNWILVSNVLTNQLSIGHRPYMSFNCFFHKNDSLFIWHCQNNPAQRIALRDVLLIRRGLLWWI